jgi:hypothetical protein
MTIITIVDLFSKLIVIMAKRNLPSQEERVQEARLDKALEVLLPSKIQQL